MKCQAGGVANERKEEAGMEVRLEIFCALLLFNKQEAPRRKGKVRVLLM